MKNSVYSIFILHDCGTWEQPSFRVKSKFALTFDEIEKIAQGRFGGFASYGLQEDDGADENDIVEIDCESV